MSVLTDSLSVLPFLSMLGASTSCGILWPCRDPLQPKPPVLWDPSLWCQPQDAHEGKVPRILLGVEVFQSSSIATARHRLVSGLIQELEGASRFLAPAELPVEMQRC